MSRPWAPYPLPVLALAGSSLFELFYPLSWVSVQLHPSSQRPSRVSGDSLRAESWQCPQLTGGQPLPGHEQTNRLRPNSARAHGRAELSLLETQPQTAHVEQGTFIGTGKVTPACSP